MILYHLEKEKYREIWPPQGSLYGEGRWNKPGQWIIYTSPSIALAKLEILANEPLLPDRRVCVTIEIDAQAEIYEINPNDLPEDWHAVPYPPYLHLFTKRSINQGNLLIKVPSAQSWREFNYLINVRHPQFFDWVKVIDTHLELFDNRLK